MAEIRDDRALHRAVLIERNGHFFFYEPALGVIASADDVKGAYEKFVEMRRQFMNEVKEAGLADGRTAPASAMQPNRPVGGEIRIFLAKFGIVFLALAIVAGGIGIGIGQAVDRLSRTMAEIAKPLSTLSMNDVSNKAADVVNDVRSMSDERRESLRQSIGTLSREAAPFIDAWRNPPPK